MSQLESLADRAVDTLAAVRTMCDGVDNSHPERHTIRALKSAAEDILAAALRQARGLAYTAETLRSDMRRVEAEAAQAKKED